jgi:hypothetical protein
MCMAIHERKTMNAMKDSTSAVTVDEDTKNVIKDGFKDDISSCSDNSHLIENPRGFLGSLVFAILNYANISY